jgi:hypothetical protein
MSLDKKKDLLFALGALLIVAGFIKFSVAVAVIVAGVGCVVLALTPSRGK